MQVQAGRVVSIQYKLFNGDGELIDESPDGQPMAYIHGEAGVVPALESELQGKSAGDSFDVTMEPADAYGEYRAEAVERVDRGRFDNAEDMEVGMLVTANGADGRELTLRVLEINDDTLTLDPNHPLAGLTLRFTGVVAEVREPTAEELSEQAG